MKKNNEKQAAVLPVFQRNIRMEKFISSLLPGDQGSPNGPDSQS